MKMLSAYNNKLAALLASVESKGFVNHLIELLDFLVPIDDATIIYYPPQKLPEIEYFRPREDGSTRLHKFVAGAFLLDPFYQAAATNHQFGFFRMQDLAPNGFRQSEYYDSFYRKSNYKDECGFLIDTGDDGFVNISLAKVGRPMAFSKSQLAVYASVEPIIAPLAVRHWHTLDAPSEQQPNLRAQLHSALAAFGQSVLTDREIQVVNYFLHGYATRIIAERLSISIETVKLHRKNAYAKLSVRSQGELFYLFLDSLMSAKDYTGGDALESYLRSPVSA